MSRVSTATFQTKAFVFPVVEQNPQADYDEVTNILAKMWDELAEEMRITFLEKCWNGTYR